VNDLTKSFFELTSEPQRIAETGNRTRLSREDHGIRELKVPVERIRDVRHMQKRRYEADEYSKGK